MTGSEAGAPRSPAAMIRVGRAARGPVAPVVVFLAVALLGAGPAFAATKPAARDRAILAAGVIQRSDVPGGWAAHRQGPGLAPQFKGIAACKDLATVVNAAQLTVPHRASPAFADPTSGGQTAMVANTAYAFANVAAADRYLAAFRGADVPTCFTQSFQRAAKGALQGTAATVTIAPLTNFAGLGDADVGYTITLTLSASGQQQKLYDDLIAVRVGRAVLGFSFQSLGAELPIGPTMIRKASSRVAPLAT